MNCPKCASEFEKISFGDVEVDRCLGCHGLWFDMLEKRHGNRRSVDLFCNETDRPGANDAQLY